MDARVAARGQRHGEIPVLEENGASLTQTGPILLQLADRFGRFGGQDDAERFDILRWLFWDNQKLSGHMATYRFLRTFARAADPAVLARHRARVDDFLGIADRHLVDRPFVAGGRPTIADISMCAYLSFPQEETGYDLAVSYRRVEAWLQRLATLPGWRSPYDLLPGKRLPHYA